MPLSATTRREGFRRAAARVTTRGAACAQRGRRRRLAAAPARGAAPSRAGRGRLRRRRPAAPPRSRRGSRSRFPYRRGHGPPRGRRPRTPAPSRSRPWGCAARRRPAPAGAAAPRRRTRSRLRCDEEEAGTSPSPQGRQKRGGRQAQKRGATGAHFDRETRPGWRDRPGVRLARQLSVRSTSESDRVPKGRAADEDFHAALLFRICPCRRRFASPRRTDRSELDGPVDQNFV
jgi:hypothetical protein